MNLRLTKKIISISFAAMMSGCMIGNPDALTSLTQNITISASAASASGNCGTGLTWTVSGDTLKITGSGKNMNNYSSGTAPWYAYRASVKKLILPSTLQKIGNYAFSNMTALECIYTANTSQRYLPDSLTAIGSYAFQNCTSLAGTHPSTHALNCGNTGNSGASTKKTLEFGTGAFKNCSSIRSIYVNPNIYKTANFSTGAFINANALTMLNMNNVTASFGSKAFRNCSNLSGVSFKPSVLPIHNTAFVNTAYSSNQCTDADYNIRNLGSASKLEGKQLVVNFFVDRLIMNLDNPVIRKTLQSADGLQVGENQIATGLPIQNQYAPSLVGVFNKDEMTCALRYSWNAAAGSKTSDSAIELNKQNYNNLPDTSRIPYFSSLNNTDPGLQGSYVRSGAMTARLNDVRAAMDDLQTQSHAYGGDFSYVMYPETNFHITYDVFDWTTYDANWQGHPLGFISTRGYNGNTGEILPDTSYGKGTKWVNDSASNPLHTSILAASEELAGENAYPIDMTLNPGSDLSDYTDYLMNQYHVDGVIYLFHLNTEARSFASPVCSDTTFNRVDDCAFIFPSAHTSETIEHETAHLFGAVDYYEENVFTPLPAAGRQYVDSYFTDGELMLDDKRIISPVTAFSVGWLDRLHTDTYNSFFAEYMK